MPNTNARNKEILDGYTSIVNIPRGVEVEKATGEFSGMVSEQDAIIKKYGLKVSDFK